MSDVLSVRRGEALEEGRFPQPTGVAIRDAVTDDGSPAGSKLGMVQELGDGELAR
jgi:hypothetical protein